MPLPAAIGRSEAVFATRLARRAVNQTRLDLFTECMSGGGRYSAVGLQQLTAEHFTQCLKEQREEENSHPGDAYFEKHANNHKQKKRRHEMRHAVGPAENVENNSFAVTGLLKICSHCERLSKKVRERKEKRLSKCTAPAPQHLSAAALSGN